MSEGATRYPRVYRYRDPTDGMTYLVGVGRSNEVGACLAYPTSLRSWSGLASPEEESAYRAHVDGVNK